MMECVTLKPLTHLVGCTLVTIPIGTVFYKTCHDTYCNTEIGRHYSGATVRGNPYFFKLMPEQIPFWTDSRVFDFIREFIENKCELEGLEEQLSNFKSFRIP